MNDEPNKLEKINESQVVKAEKKESQPWDESRVVMFLIGVCLLIEGLLIYYQAGASQALVLILDVPCLFAFYPLL